LVAGFRFASKVRATLLKGALVVGNAVVIAVLTVLVIASTDRVHGTNQAAEARN